MNHSIDESKILAAVLKAVDRCNKIDSLEERNSAIRRAAVEEGYRLASSELADVLRQCRSRVAGMQAIQGRDAHLGHTQLLVAIDALLSDQKQPE